MKKFAVFPNLPQTDWGIRYLLFQLLVLPHLIGWLSVMLNLPITGSQLNLLCYTINFASLVYLFRHFLKASLLHAKQNLGAVLGAAVVGYFAFRFATILMDIGIHYLLPNFSNVNDANINTMAKNQLPLWAFATVVLVPPAEELIFRGALFGGLYNKSKLLAWLVSVLAFAGLHIASYIGSHSWDVLLISFLQYLPASICFAAAYRHSGNIFSPILMHAINNALVMVSLARMS